MKLVLILVIFFTAKSELFEFLSDETVDNFHGHPYGHPKPLMWLESNNDSIMVDYEIISNIFFNEDIADRKIVVVSVIGALRKGKSFLLDYFLRYMYNNYKSMGFKNNPLNNKRGWLGKPEDELLGFSWRGGSERHTKGIIMWSDVFLYDIEQPGKPDEKLAIVFFDTQGLFDAKTSPADNARIFAIGTLMSSLQIFNFNDVIQENQLEYLQMATDYAQFHTNLDDTHKPFQNILFLLRDWVHVNDYPYGFSGGREYIAEIFLIRKYQSPALRMVRKNIKDSFDNIDCFLLPHPGSKITMRGHNGSFALMEEKFRENLVQLIEDLMQPRNLVRKRILGDSVNSREFGEYLKTFLDIFQSSETPRISSVYEATVERQHENHLALCMEKYSKELRSNLDMNQPIDGLEQSLKAVNKAARKTVLLYDKSLKKMGTEEYVEKYQQRLKEEMKAYSKEWKKSIMKAHGKLMMQKEFEAALAKVKKDNEEKRKEEKENFERESQKINEIFLSQVEENQQNSSLTKKLKQDHIDKLLKEIEKNEKEENGWRQEQLDKHKAEEERNIRMYEMEMRRRDENIEESRRNEMESIKKRIEENRQMFFSNRETMIEEILENFEEMKKRWKREEEQRDEQMELLGNRTDIDAIQQIRDIERQDTIRNQARNKARKNIEIEIAMINLQNIEMSTGREMNRVEFQEQLALLASLQRQRSSFSTTSLNIMILSTSEAPKK